ncbi:hydroxypyruvate isomerase [Massilia sp. Dwa41.01b]|uniref:2-oxo-tetronate isomerase n=1 Tax=unclassified Massilia TaxID=2609279 RepID=UPI001603115B|nr:MULTISPECIES: 2-oxo-tetronate isomerase [unclassified Massilia]QNA88575.1 hydroxypyruvate isomerase [Massilia sp. Dwa41.01b]QNA99471.1 hydroxypyruvate isomerase [Massilia sp. Se16.2.3]
MPKFAANLSTLFNELSLLDRFAAAREAGFDAVEFLFPYACEPESIAGRLARYKLELVLHNFPAGDWAAGERGMACDPRRVQEFQDSVELAIDYAEELGVKRLHCMAGKLPPNVAPERAHATFVANLKFAAAELAPRGIDLLIEPINDRDMPGYFLTRSRQAQAIIEECAVDNLFLQFDIYHMQRMEGDLGNSIRSLLPLIRHIQLADVPGRHEPGTGEIHFPYLFRLLDELGYGGWIGCEYTPQAGTLEGLAWRTALAGAASPRQKS